MSAHLRATILGCGSSAGVPRIGGDWGACDPGNPRNRRSRCSLLVERVAEAGVTRVLIDTTPDLRTQLLAAGVGVVDGVVYTHPHADHVHGIDDLRTLVHNSGLMLPVWADAETADVLITRFAYVFVQPPGSLYPPILSLRSIEGPIEVVGEGGAIRLEPFRVRHGRIDALGFRIGSLAYLPDVSSIPDEVWPVLADLDVWILDALRHKPHPTHSHVAQSLEWIERARPRLGILTDLHNDLDYAALTDGLPEGVVPAYDGLTIDFSA